ncbi:hypothetical protein SRABI106_04642 [Rahnella aquatilis]|nr:hypothetical protein SRABI106_04642 [Rahnella aquatilis]
MIDIAGGAAIKSHPFTTADRTHRRGRLAVLQPGLDHRACHRAVVFAFQPVIPPAHGFLQETDRRFRRAILRIDMRPRTENGAAWHFQIVHQAEHCIAVGICPAADGHHRTLNGGPVFAHRTMLPVCVAQRMFHPQCREEWHVFQTVQPVFVPPFTDQCGVGRSALVRQHDAAPPEIVIKQAAAFVVNIVAVTVVS